MKACDVGRAILAAVLATLAACNGSGNSDTTVSPSNTTQKPIAGTSAGTVVLSSAQYMVSMTGPQATATIQVDRTGSSAEAASVRYQTLNGTATAGVDFLPSTGSLSWAPGDGSSRNIIVPVNEVSRGKQFGVALTAVTGSAGVGSPNVATIAVSGMSSVPAESNNSLSSSGSSANSANSSDSIASGSGATSTNASAGSPTVAARTITQIQVVGAPIKVFDHIQDRQEADNVPDAQITAWKEADGTVDLSIPNIEWYRMRGPDLEHLAIDRSKIYSSTQSGSQTAENLYNYHHWMMGAYSLDGKNLYTLTHSEWYGCMLEGDCASTPISGGTASVNSWANTVNSFTSADGGATWQLNTVSGNHSVAKTAFTWTGSQALAELVYLHAADHSGIFNPSRLIREGDHFYTVATYIHRDFSQINVAAGVLEAPIDKTGYVIMRTSDFTNPNLWQAWSGGSNYGAISNQNINVFLPKQGPITLNAGQPQLIYDTNAQCYILIYALNGVNGAVYFMTTKSLATPIWSDSQAIQGTASLTTDPAGPVVGFMASNFPSVIDDNSGGFSFEFTSGNPQLFFSTFPLAYGGNNTARDIYRLQLQISYH